MSFSRIALMEPPLLSRQQGCVAAWHAGGLPGSSLTSDGKLRDFIRNTHHATFIDSTNPLPLAPELGKWFVHFPGTSGNSATITLSDSTVYDYTITYSDGTTDTDTQTSTGAGLLTFGGTDAKFAGLKVRRIVITADGGGATIADIDFSQRSLWNETRTSLTAVTGGQTVTINRTTSGRKTSVVDRPLLLFGADDYLQVTHHADLVFGAGDSFTVAMALRQYDTPVNTGRYMTKGTTTPRWLLAAQTTTHAGRFQILDGVASPFDASPSITAGTAHVKAGVRRASISVECFANATTNSRAADTTTSTIDDPAEDLYIGAAAAAASRQDFEFFAAAIFRRALSLSEIRQLGRELGITA